MDVQRGCGFPIPGDIQNPTGHSPEQPALVDPAFSREFGLDDLQRSLLTSIIQ